jgi:hypothetical protein
MGSFSFLRIDLKPPCWRFRSGIGKAARLGAPAAVAFLMRASHFQDGAWAALSFSREAVASHARSTSATLQAWATQPRGV